MNRAVFLMWLDLEWQPAFQHIWMIAGIKQWLCDLNWDKERFCEGGLGREEEKEVNLVQNKVEVMVNDSRHWFLLINHRWVSIPLAGQYNMITETLNVFQSDHGYCVYLCMSDYSIDQLKQCFTVNSGLYVYVQLRSNHTNVLFSVFIWFQAPWNLNKLGKAEIRDCAITIVTLIKREFSNGILEHFKDIPIGC